MDGVEKKPEQQTPGDDRLEGLLEGLLVSEITPDELSELTQLTEGDTGAMRRYAETIHLRESLFDFASSTPGSVAGPTVSRLFDEVALASRTDPDERAARGSAAPTIRKADSSWKAWFPLALATSIALMLGATGGYFVSVDGSGQQARSALLGPPTSVLAALPPVAEAGHRDRLGSITALSPEASSDGLLRSLQVGEELRRGEVIQLTRGAMQVGFAGGGEVIVEGPAEFSVVADHAIYVHKGRVKATAPGEFVVQTSLVSAEATDARLGVVANGDKDSTIFAYSGEVQVRSNPHRNVRYELLDELTAGQGVEVSLDKPASQLAVTQSSVSPELVTAWGQVTEKLHPYEQLVLSDQPLAYWPLYRVRRNRRVLDLTQNGFDGQAIGNWPSELSDASSSQVRGAYFDGESYIEPDNKPPVDLLSGFAIEGWAKVLGGPEFQSVFTSRWVFASNTPNQQCFGFTLYAGDDDCWQFWSGSGEYGAPWQTLQTQTKVSRNRWVHVAATFTPQRVQEGRNVEGLVELYVGGEKVAQAVQRLSLMDFEWPARIGAAEFVPKSLTSWLFQGELRDVALYDYPISVKQIKNHYAAGEAAI